MTDQTQTLIAALRGAFERRDEDEFRALSGRYADWLDANLDSWMRVSDAGEQARLREDPEALQRNGAFVIAVARALDDLGRPGALNRMLGSDGGGPFEAFYSTLAEARELSAYGEHEAARSQVIAAIRGLEGSSGSGMASMLTEGHLELTYLALRQGDLSGAVTHNIDALRTVRPDSRIPKATIEQLYADLQLAFGLERGDPGAAALAHVRAVVVRAQKLSDGGRYRASNAALDEVMNEREDGADRSDSHREAVARYHAKILGLRGLNLLRLGDKVGARAATRQALQICRQSRDEFGANVYEASLRHMEREG